MLSKYLASWTYCSNGPNDVWHCDGYDKINQYGFPIHGGADGFSRKILWLKVVRSNNNPIVPATLYLRAIKEQGLSPNLLKTDCGSENGDIAAVHCFLTGSNLSHRYGASHANQRIENWWTRSFSGCVIDFKQPVYDGIFVPGNVIHMECIRFVYADFLQRKLDQVKNEWNFHTIRCTKGSQVSGIRNHLYYLPDIVTLPILLMYYNKGILKKSSNRSWKEVTISYKSIFVTLLQTNKWVILLLTGTMQKHYS